MRSVATWAVLGLLFATAACAGPDGPEGPQGETSEAGAQGIAGPAGPAGPAGAPGGSMLTDGGAATQADIPVGCLSPCHGFEGVVAQFKTSAHYIAYVQNLGTDTATEWTATGSACGNCHAVDGLERRVAGKVGTTNDGGIVNLATGELQFRDPVTMALATSTYTGSAATAEVYCTTCHAVTNANDPHKTGIPWTPGSFPLVVSAEGAAINLEKSPSAAVVGTEASGPDGGNFGPGATCMWCHRSRVDVTNYLTASNVITSTHWGPHEGPQADLFTGKGGYEYAGQTYGEATHEQKLSCVDCHMVNMAENGGVPDHSFAPQISACVSCHAGATTFNVNGFESQVKAALTQIETYLNGQGLLTRAAAAPYLPLTAANLGDGSWDLDQPVPAGGIDGGLQTLTKDQAGALYNYILVARGGAFGVHNPKYIAEILYDSYHSLTGLPLAAFPARP